ncbi:zinc finger protein ZFAT isoform B [Alligator mississippiensis]|uniref:Zinc finger protein ZFAT n=1 Tax=Alligator mississippiensis TaxID=8496 RepID=A0A151P805_ALLMI|nr:zinc finger protein ZFAT isoform B [Alligator mississippiensis]
MEAPAAGISSIFMCKLCNLFSPNQSELLSHVSEKHAEEGINVDDIVIPLRPLTEPTNTSKSGEVKRKRGRPKGSTKKYCADEELAENNNIPSEEAQPGPEEGTELAEVLPGSLECKKCNRKFSNTRQLRKHICIIVLNEGEDEGDPGNDSDVDLDRKEDERERTPKRPRVPKTEKTLSAKETDQISGAKNPIISVILTAHEAIPGATKIVPVEAAPQETEPTTNSEAAVQDQAQRRGYQEYAIQQTPYEQAMKSSRLGPTQLKIFTCEYCNKVFKFKHSLQAHLRIHTNEKPYKCSYCSYASAIKANLNVHMRKHTGEKFSCDYCAFTCLSKGHLKVHIERVHKKIKQHCRFCKKKYSDVKNLIKHIKETHDLKDKKVKDVFDELRLMTREGKRQLLYDCHICERKFKNELDRDRHMLVHELENSLVESAAELPCQPSTDAEVPQIESHAAPNCFLLKNAASTSEEPKLSPGNEQEVNCDSSVNIQGDEIQLLLPGGKDSSVNHNDINIESLSVSDEKGQPFHASELETSTSSNQNMAESTNPLSAPDSSEAISPKPNSSSTASDTRGGAVAFMQILDGLQKRQMNTELCEKIRKVYGDLECEYCGKLFWYQVHYDMHVRTHTREHLYYCSQCNYSSITKNCLKRHVIQKHSNILLKCPTEHCDYSTPDKYKLQAHLKVHTELDKKSYSCPVCEKSFSEDRLIKSHIKTNHPEVSMNTISKVLGRRVQLKGLIGKRAVKCPYCDFYFMKNGSDLQRHIWAHEGIKPFKCSLCDYATRSKSNLKAHMNRHSTEKTHLCDMCGKKFKSKGTLKSHKLLHTADGKQFKCTVCDYTAAQKPQLLRHMEQHVSFKPFRCAHCHYSCNISGSLKRHYNRKHPNEEYVNVGTGELAAEALIQQGGIKCPVCSFVYGTKWEFNRHLKNKHGLKLIEQDGETKWELTTEISEESSPHYLHITEAEEDVQGTQAAVAALQDLRYTSENGERLDPTAVNILQQIIELGSETHDAAAVASVVTMAPGTVTVVKQVKEEEQSANHTVMIQETLQQASVELSEQHHLVVSSDEVEGIETVTVYTQGGEASEFIVYVQEAMQPLEEQAVEHSVQEI